MWDQRYSAEEYVYGKEPNTYFRDQLNKLTPGNLLLPGEGEGRNAVYAASVGWNVTAFDTSSEGQKKALSLAEEKGVSIDFNLASYLDFEYPEKRYDVIGLFFTHQPSEMRKVFHKKILQGLKPGGMIILEAFHKEQINNNTGGPQSPDFLYSEADLEKDFSTLKIKELNAIQRDLREGEFHRGISNVIQLIAIKAN